jgi:hypothetical protein
MRPVLMAIVAGFGWLMLSGSNATTLKTVPLLEQIRKADTIVHGNITGIRVEERRGKPWTVYTLNLKKTIKGKLEPATVAILGGEFDGKTYKLEHAPSFKRDDELFLFLYDKAFDSPIVGFNQGIYRVQNDRVFDTNGLVIPIISKGIPVEATSSNFAAWIDEQVKNPTTTGGTQ